MKHTIIESTFKDIKFPNVHVVYGPPPLKNWAWAKYCDACEAYVLCIFIHICKYVNRNANTNTYRKIFIFCIWSRYLSWFFKKQMAIIYKQVLYDLYQKMQNKKTDATNLHI